MNRNNELDNKYANLSLNRSQHYEDHNELVNNRMSMRGEIIMMNVAKDNILEKVNRNPFKH